MQCLVNEMKTRLYGLCGLLIAPASWINMSLEEGTASQPQLYFQLHASVSLLLTSNHTDAIFSGL